jgi:alanyl-tRNA synthetase
MTANELRKKFIDFFKEKGHVEIPSASLVPENDPTVLFTTAGMHPLVPFLLGETHPSGKRLVSCQRCIRTGDIDAVGDDVHLTFFEMLGNWSLGDYWKKEAIEWSWEFLTKEKWLGLEPSKIYVTCFAGDEDAPKDNESASMWMSVGLSQDRIAFLGKEDNWWGPAGQTGPCGPDTEIFYQVNTVEDERPSGTHWPKGKYVEIWNDVFMQYKKTREGTFVALRKKNVDTGMGVERTLTAIHNVQTVFDTEIFYAQKEYIKSLCKNYNEKSARIIADHIKSAAFLIADGVRPSNKEQGYVLRRFIRKVVRESQKIGFDDLHEQKGGLLTNIFALYGDAYPHVIHSEKTIREEILAETMKFTKTVHQGLKILIKEIEAHEIGRHSAAASENVLFSGKVAFDLYQTYGFPKELIQEELRQFHAVINQTEWQAAEDEHKNLSRRGAEQKFIGGLADHSERVIRMHTATHLLHQALKDTLGDHVRQKGSNITKERLRFDFTHPEKLTKGQLIAVEHIVNQKIAESIPVKKRILTFDEAKRTGATGLFEDTYGENVSVYFIGTYSKEFCGGPHVTNTNKIGTFHILKEEAVSSGIRRIKATIDQPKHDA